MRELPILFSTPMVEGIQDAIKNMTRRLTGLDLINENPDDWEFNWFDYQVGWCFNKLSTINSQSLKDRSFTQVIVKCPYGLVGDWLWVRESWCHEFTPENHSIKFKAGGENIKFPIGFKWHPSIHMFKKDARIWLEVKEIRVERLHKITKEDSKAEGIELITTTTGGGDLITYKNYEGFTSFTNPITSFKSLWNSINGHPKPNSNKPITNWEANPWVWVVVFEVLSKNGKPSGV
jgi:hypothetical protein